MKMKFLTNYFCLECWWWRNLFDYFLKISLQGAKFWNFRKWKHKKETLRKSKQSFLAPSVKSESLSKWYLASKTAILFWKNYLFPSILFYLNLFWLKIISEFQNFNVFSSISPHKYNIEANFFNNEGLVMLRLENTCGTKRWNKAFPVLANTLRAFCAKLDGNF